jgi:hypothetical protein
MPVAVASTLLASVMREDDMVVRLDRTIPPSPFGGIEAICGGGEVLSLYIVES